MQVILQQLGALMVGAIPTALLFIVLVIAYEFLIQRPLSATLKERHARTEGAMEEAQEAIALAERKAAEYAEKLRLARVEVHRAREQRLKMWHAERDTTLEAARKAAEANVRKATAALEAEAATARQTIEASAAELANQVVRAVLPAAAGGSL